jgi:hypothetical protein
MDPVTQQKIVIENGSGRKYFKNYIPDPTKMPKFLKGKNTVSVLEHPGSLSEIMKKITQNHLVFPDDLTNVKKYFWDVDMSEKDHIHGAKKVLETRSDFK